MNRPLLRLLGTTLVATSCLARPAFSKDEPQPPVEPPKAGGPPVDEVAPAQGAPGPGGGGRTERQLSHVVQQFPNSRVIINLDVTYSMWASRDAVARVIPRLRRLPVA